MSVFFLLAEFLSGFVVVWLVVLGCVCVWFFSAYVHLVLLGWVCVWVGRLVCSLSYHIQLSEMFSC